MSVFDIVLTYLALPSDYVPSPHTDPIAFLSRHLHHLPPHILAHFSSITSAKQRTIIPIIRNRRLKYANTTPTELSFQIAKKTWPHLWKGHERAGLNESRDEKEWANHNFLAGHHQHVGKLGSLLGQYEEEREAERTRTLRRTHTLTEEFVEEEDESESGEEPTVPVEETEQEAIASFERVIRERLIYGLLEDFDYDRIDWDESLDTDDDREAEERWFDEEEENM
ncbi:hypothetical protein APHAL10511_001709 [Amanita phalloides]|nr:hypothetical protein APHAL10511_001709 [Amanita phalloides]